MGLVLKIGTNPKDLYVSTDFDGRVILIGEYKISMEDFLSLAVYALTNTNLTGDNDPRLQFIKCVQAMKIVDGYMSLPEPEEKLWRLKSDVQLVFQN